MTKGFSEDFCRKHGWWLLLLVTALLYLPGSGTLPLMDRDEPRFAHATVEMMERGTWTIPYFNGEYRFDKPPLTYWWMRLHYSLLGVNEMAARLHSVTATWLVALVIAGIGSRMSTRRTGVAAGVAWLTTLQVIVHGRLCVADMPMVLCVALASRAIMELLGLFGEKPDAAASAKWFWVLWVSLGLGFLAKGPIAWLVPGVGLGLWRWAFWRQPVAWARLHLWPGLLITLVIISAWGVPALLETRGAFWQVGMGEHIVKRGTDVFNGRAFVPGYYFVTALVSLFPWIGFLPTMIRMLRAEWTPQCAFLVSWFAAPYLIFFAYATQLPHYVMPGFPAFALLAVMACVSFEVPASKWSFGLTFGFLMLLLGLGLKVAAESADGITPELKAWLVEAGGLLKMIAFSGGLLFLLPWQKRWLAGFLLMVVAGTIAMTCGQLREVSPVVALKKRHGDSLKDADLIACHFTEPSLVFYANREWKFTGKFETVDRHLSKPGKKLAVLLRREWTLNGWLQHQTGRGKPDASTPDRDLSAEVDALRARHPEARASMVSGLNLARSSWVEITVLTRD
jgi:4-amino-4-deoxy-L-arabinose transferase-like glycosyltransferase